MEMTRRDLTAYALAKLAGLDPGVVKRFVDGKRGLTSDSVDRLLAALELRIVPKTKPRKKAT